VIIVIGMMASSEWNKRWEVVNVSGKYQKIGGK